MRHSFSAFLLASEQCTQRGVNQFWPIVLHEINSKLFPFSPSLCLNPLGWHRKGSHQWMVLLICVGNGRETSIVTQLSPLFQEGQFSLWRVRTCLRLLKAPCESRKSFVLQQGTTMTAGQSAISSNVQLNGLSVYTQQIEWGGFKPINLSMMFGINWLNTLSWILWVHLTSVGTVFQYKALPLVQVFTFEG